VAMLSWVQGLRLMDLDVAPLELMLPRGVAVTHDYPVGVAATWLALIADVDPEDEPESWVLSSSVSA